MSVTLDWVGIQGWNLVDVCSMSGATVMQDEASGCLSVWIWDGYEWKGTFQSIIFYILQHFTLTGDLGQLRGVLGGRGSTHLVSYFPSCTHGWFWLKTIYFISDLKNDFLMI